MGACFRDPYFLALSEHFMIMRLSYEIMVLKSNFSGIFKAGEQGVSGWRPVITKVKSHLQIKNPTKVSMKQSYKSDL